jgi:hypothetical protein
MFIRDALQVNEKLTVSPEKVWKYQIEDRSDSYTLLQYASGNGHTKAVGALVQYNELAQSQKIDHINLPSYRRGQTALYLAAANG